MRSLSRARRWLRGIAVFVTAGVTFAAAGQAVNDWLDHSHERHSQPSATSPAPQPGASPMSSSAWQSASSALASPVRVVPGTKETDGIWLGYPHTLTGAVSAAAVFTPAILGTLDPDRAARVMRLVADPSFPQGPAQAAEGVTGIRESLGLAATGPVPQGYSWAIAPVECQVRDIETDRVTVLLLMDLTSAVPGAGTITRATVFPVAVHWAAADWKILPTPATSYAQLIAAPGSQQAANLGWLPLTGAQS